ncbi:MAG: glycosyltransferase family A protein, partial [archaeon]
MEFKYITIIIPSYNPNKLLLETIRSIKKLKYPSKLFETIIVDDGSTNRAIFTEIKNLQQSNIKVIHLKENKGPANARNIGASNASSKSEILLFIDSTVKVDENLLLYHCSMHKTFPEIAAVNGK